MALKKCPKCELNYIKEGEQYCNVCMRTLKNGRNHAEPVADEEELLCSECGENPAVHGYELCTECLREQARQAELEESGALDDDADEDFDSAGASEDEI